MSDNAKRRYNESDIPFLKSIANQLALSIVNVRLYNKAQSSIKLREEILAIVSHDLRSPLTSIQMTGQLLPKIAEDKSKVLKFSEKILSSAYQMKRMIEDLMDFAKIQEGNLSIEMKNEEPTLVVESVFEMMNGQATEKGIQLSREASPKLPVVKYDKQRIVQVLVNLVGNAIKFSRSGGHVHLAAFEFNSGVKFSVTDNGLGISEEDLPKIFDRYWQASRSKTASAGLGLSITKGIIEAHGSQIKVESQLGKGSTFYFVLPVSNETRY
jgi:signal transduction histidine kinase